jgi:hypothetical protein
VLREVGFIVSFYNRVHSVLCNLCGPLLNRMDDSFVLREVGFIMSYVICVHKTL